MLPTGQRPKPQNPKTPIETFRIPTSKILSSDQFNTSTQNARYLILPHATPQRTLRKTNVKSVSLRRCSFA